MTGTPDAEATADQAWEAWRLIDDHEWHAHPISRSALDAGFVAGQIYALEQVAEWLEDKPTLPRWLSKRLRKVEETGDYIASELRAQVARLQAEQQDGEVHRAEGEEHGAGDGVVSGHEPTVPE